MAVYENLNVEEGERLGGHKAQWEKHLFLTSSPATTAPTPGRSSSKGPEFIQAVCG